VAFEHSQNKRPQKRVDSSARYHILGMSSLSWVLPIGSNSIMGNALTCVPPRGVSHCGLAIYIKKYLRAKEEL